jgi:hypothetical protein
MKCWNDNLHIIITVNIYFMYLDCCFMSQSIFISNFISFDRHFKPYNLTWYATVLILYVFSISKLACTFFCYVNFLTVFHFHALYVFCLMYILYGFLTCSVFCGLWPHVLGLNESKSKYVSSTEDQTSQLAKMIKWQINHAFQCF